MNKNSLLAFGLIAFTVIFFNSDTWNNFWYGTVLKKPVPTRQQPVRQSTLGGDEGAAVRESSAPAGSANDAVIAPAGDAQAAAARDGAAYTQTDSDNADDEAEEIVKIVEDTVFVETNRLIAGISTKGARIVSLKMKDYLYAAGQRRGEMIDLLPAGSDGGAQLAVNNESFDDKFFTVINDIDDNRHVTVCRQNGYQLILEARADNGRPVRKVFTFADDTYRIGYAIRGSNIAGRKITVGWSGGIEESESGNDMPFGGMMDKRRAHYSDGKSVEHFEMRRPMAETPSGLLRWVGMSSKYFFVAVVAEKTAEADLRIVGRGQSSGGRQQREQIIDYSIYYTIEAESNEVEKWIYAGPGKIEELSLHGMKFEKTLFPVLSWARHIFWAGAWFPPLAEIILKVLLFFYNLVKDYGIAIFLLTLLSKVVTFPMTQSSMKSMARMKEVQPKLLALRNKHKGNPQKMNQEMMALYKAEGINPLNPGCLPMFLQMPIFIALFVVLRKAIELRGASSFLLPWVPDLSMPEALFYLPFAIPIYGNNVALMPIIMAALTYFQQKQMITDPNQKMLLYMMPVLMLVMFNSFPAGVVFYWTVSSALGLLQQKMLKVPNAPKSAAAAGADITADVTVKTSTPAVAKKKSSSSGGSGKGKRKK